MEILIEKNLYGADLVKISNQIDVENYNNCLKDIGLIQTKLSEFHIDKMGWSPEIAKELNNVYYLSLGEKVNYAIILNPSQKDCTIYYPIHSFDYELLDEIYIKYYRQIIDITIECPIWFEIRYNILFINNYDDIFEITNINIQFNPIKNIFETYKIQLNLEKIFINDINSWKNTELMNKIINSVNEYGDLRRKNIIMSDFAFDNFNSFYTSKFGGIYVIKNSFNNVLVYENKSFEQTNKNNKNEIKYIYINDNSIFSLLYNYQLIDNTLSYNELQTNIIDNLLYEYVMEKIINEFPSENIQIDNINKYINKIINIGNYDDYFLDLYNLKYRKYSKITEIKSEVQILLAYPKNNLDNTTKSIIWRLLQYLTNNKNIILLYLYNKNEFYNYYNTKNDKIKQWIVEKIIEKKKTIFELCK